MSRPRRRPHAQLHLPPLEAHEALALVAICERLIAAVWRAHGDAMVDIKANGLPPEPFRPTSTDVPLTNDDPDF
jgi:hypothetical protein